MSLETMTKLATVTVGAGGSSTITFSNIPQTYTDLKLVYSLRNTTGNTTMQLTFNSDGNRTNYLYRQFYGTGSAVNNDTQSDIFFGNMDPSTYTASTFSNGEIYIPNYFSTNQKSVSADSVIENNATAAVAALLVGRWIGTAAITTIQLSCYSGTLAEFSSATLYGVKNYSKSVPTSANTTGGTKTSDGTYVTHTFTSTGTFTFTTATQLDADILVVAGGGGGAHGGGGAGGLLTFTSQTLAATSSGYVVTVGAGGTAGLFDVQGGLGNDSQFGLLTLVKGGGGGGYVGSTGQTNGSAGGSGGGGAGSSSSLKTGGAATSGQGNAGGSNGSQTSSPYPSGGGGGAGAVGANAASTNLAGAGGIGLASSLSGSTVYYAGGGGGGNYAASGTAGAGGTGGGGAGSVSSAGTAGTANTGGGGGGGGTTGAAGGSGIVIVRYKIKQ